MLKLRRLKPFSAQKERKYLSSIIESNHLDKLKLRTSYQLQYKQWKLLLHRGYNLLYYGIGSKKSILTEFAKEMLYDGHVIILNGYYPTINIKYFLKLILEHDVNYHHKYMNTINDQLEYLAKNYPKRQVNNMMISNSMSMSINKTNSRTLSLNKQKNEKKKRNKIYLVIHNIDAESLRINDIQLIFSTLATIANIHIIASIDHSLSSLLWNHRQLQQFNWLSYDITNFNWYNIERKYHEFLVSGGAKVKATGIIYTMQGFTPNHKKVLYLLAEKQLKAASKYDQQYRKLLKQKKYLKTLNKKCRLKNPDKYYGITFTKLYQICRLKHITSSDTQLREYINEFIEQKLLAIKKIDGIDRYYIPYSYDIIEAYILKH